MKKSLALILALIMLLCMLPSVAFAALDTGHSIDVRFTVLYVSDEFYLGYNTGSSEKTTFVCQYSTSHSDTAYNNHTIAISDIKAAADRASVNSGYQIVGWTKEAKATPTIWGFNLTDPTACNKGDTIYLVAKESNPKPGKPSDNDIYGIVGDNAVKVHCTNDKSGHADETYALIAGSFTIGDVTKDNASGKYSCTITVYAGKYVEKYNTTRGSHTLDQNENTAVIKLEYNNGKWGKGTQTPVVFNVKCENQTPDNPPAQPDPRPSATPTIDGLTGVQVVEVECVTDGSKHEGGKYQLISGSYQVGAVQGDATNGYTCDITVYPGKYVEAYNTDIMVTHTLATAGQTGTITLRWKPDVGQDGTAKWIVDRGVPVVFKVVCAPVVDPSKPEKPSDDAVKTLLGDVVTIDCTNNKVTHEDKTYGLLPGGFSVGDVEGNKEDGYTVNVTVTPDAYVTQYSNDIGEKHNLSPDGQDNLIITLKCAGKGSEWEFVPFTTKTYTVVCETGVTDTVTVSFDSNGGTAVAPQTINKGEKATRPANPTMDGYTFVNWYLDGKVYDFNKPVDKDITLLAQWKKNDDNPGQNPYPDPSPKPNPGGHDHGNSTVVVPITVYMPPKTGDMPFWYSIAQFLGLVK